MEFKKAYLYVPGIRRGTEFMTIILRLKFETPLTTLYFSTPDLDSKLDYISLFINPILINNNQNMIEIDGMLTFAVCSLGSLKLC